MAPSGQVVIRDEVTMTHVAKPSCIFRDNEPQQHKFDYYVKYPRQARLNLFHISDCAGRTSAGKKVQKVR